MQRELTDHEVAHFHEHGWVFAPKLIDPGTATRMAPEAEAVLRASQYRSVTAYVDNAFKLQHDEGTPLTTAVSLCPEAGRNLARILRGAPRAKLWQRNFLGKFGVGDDAENGATPFHQDFPGHPLDRSEMVTFWVALTPLDADMGALRFADGSHRYGSLGRSFVRPNDDTLSMHPWLRERCPVTPSRAMQPGDATLHHGLCVHGADKNASSKPRLAFQMLYIDAEALYTGSRVNKRWDAYNLELHKPPEHPLIPLVPIA